MFKSQSLPITNEMAPNTVSGYSGFHLSFNNRTAHYGCETTAFVLKNSVFLLLNGDHREQMDECAAAGGLQACFDYYVDNIHLANGMGDLQTVVKGCKSLGYVQDTAREALGEENLRKLQAALFIEQEDEKVLPLD
jgi:hypothetical protein